MMGVEQGRIAPFTGEKSMAGNPRDHVKGKGFGMAEIRPTAERTVGRAAQRLPGDRLRSTSAPDDLEFPPDPRQRRIERGGSGR